MQVAVDDPWNIRCVDILFNKLREIIKGTGNPSDNTWDSQTEAYWRDMIVQKFQRLRAQWRRAQFFQGETEEEWEERMEKEKKEAAAKARRLSRRRMVKFHKCVTRRMTNTDPQKYAGRVEVAELVIKVKRAKEDEDVKVWEWMLRLLQTLRADGMSSDETDKEEGHDIYRVRIMPWRREGVVHVMDVLDAQKLKNSKLSKAQRARPVKRLRGTEAQRISSRRYVNNLPRPLYNAEWLNVPANSVVVEVSKDMFEWVQVLVRNI